MWRKTYTIRLVEGQKKKTERGKRDESVMVGGADGRRDVGLEEGRRDLVEVMER